MKEQSPIYTTVLFMGLISLSIILFIGVSINIFTGGVISVKNENFRKEFLASFIILTELSFLIWTYYRYTREGKIKELEEKYSSNKYNKLKPWHIFMLPVFFIILMVIILLSFGNVVFLPNRN